MKRWERKVLWNIPWWPYHREVDSSGGFFLRLWQSLAVRAVNTQIFVMEKSRLRLRVQFYLCFLYVA